MCGKKKPASFPRIFLLFTRENPWDRGGQKESVILVTSLNAQFTCHSWVAKPQKKGIISVNVPSKHTHKKNKQYTLLWELNGLKVEKSANPMFIWNLSLFVATEIRLSNWVYAAGLTSNYYSCIFSNSILFILLLAQLSMILRIWFSNSFSLKFVSKQFDSRSFEMLPTTNAWNNQACIISITNNEKRIENFKISNILL